MALTDEKIIQPYIPMAGSPVLNAMKQQDAMGIGRSFFWDGKRYITNEDIETVRNSIYVKPIVRAIATDVANFTYSLTEESSGWQSIFWEEYLMTGTFQRDIQELIEWAWFYARAYADSFIVLKNGFRVPKKFIPMHMRYVDDDQFGNFVKYGQGMQIPIRKNRLMEVILFTEAGRFVPFAYQVWKPIAFLDAMLDSGTRAFCANSCGVWVETFNASSAAGMRSQDTARRQLKNFNSKLGQSNFIAYDLPDGFDLKVLKSNTEINAFKELTMHVLFMIYSAMRCTFIMADSTKAWGSTEVQAQFYVNLLKSIGQGSVIDALNMTAQKVADYNMQPCTVRFSCSPSSYITRAGSNLAIVNAVKEVLLLKQSGLLTPELNESLFEMLGLPVPTDVVTIENQEEPMPVEENAVKASSTGSKASIEGLLDSSQQKNLTIFTGLLKNSRDEKSLGYMRMRDQQSIIKALGLTESKDLSTFSGYWKSLEIDVNGILARHYEMEGKWSQIKELATNEFNQRWFGFEEKILAEFVKEESQDNEKEGSQWNQN